MGGINRSGRPTKYTDTTVEQTLDYIHNHETYGDIVPSVAGLACHLGVVPSTIHKWGGEHDSFSDTLRLLQSRQERLLVSGGLGNRMNATIVKLMLANHGYHEKRDLQHSGVEPIRIEFVDA